MRIVRLLFLLTSLVAPLSSVSAQISQGRVQSMKLLTPNVGWVVTDYLMIGRGAAGRLFWTTTGGADWKDITPLKQSVERITSVFFLDSERGWVLLLELSADDEARFDVASTTDAGADWSIARVNTEAFIPKSMATLTGQGRIAFSDALHGWMNLDLQSSSAFNLGVMLMTTDGGRTWIRPSHAPVVAGDMTPLTPNDVWLGGRGDELYATHDAGHGWQQLDLKAPEEIHPAIDATYDVPTFSDAKHGFLPVTYSGPETSSAAVLFKTEDGGPDMEGRPDSGRPERNKRRAESGVGSVRLRLDCCDGTGPPAHLVGNRSAQPDEQ